MEVVPSLGVKFDLSFIDGNKRIYPEYYEMVKKYTNPGGYIIADNTLWDGHVLETDSNDAQTQGVIRFNDMVKDDNSVEKVILPIRDGLTIIRLKI